MRTGSTCCVLQPAAPVFSQPNHDQQNDLALVLPAGFWAQVCVHTCLLKATIVVHVACVWRGLVL